MLLDDSYELSSSSIESNLNIKKKNQKNSIKMKEKRKNDINKSLQKILDTKTSIDLESNENLEINDDLEVNVDIEEIVNESSNNKFKIKTLKRKKLADLQKIAIDFGISLNKVKSGKLKNKTKNELCKEIVSRQY